MRFTTYISISLVLCFMLLIIAFIEVCQYNLENKILPCYDNSNNEIIGLDCYGKEAPEPSSYFMNMVFVSLIFVMFGHLFVDWRSY